MYNPDLCESLILISFLCSNEKKKEKKRQDADEILAGVGGICISRIRFCRYGNLCVYNGFLLLRYGPNNYKLLKAGPSHTHTHSDTYIQREMKSRRSVLPANEVTSISDDDDGDAATAAAGEADDVVRFPE